MTTTTIAEDLARAADRIRSFGESIASEARRIGMAGSEVRKLTADPAPAGTTHHADLLLDAIIEERDTLGREAEQLRAELAHARQTVAALAAAEADLNAAQERNGELYARIAELEAALHLETITGPPAPTGDDHPPPPPGHVS